MSEMVRVGVIGLQHEEHVGSFMDAVVADCPNARLIAAADADERYRRDLEKYPGVKPYESWVELLDRERPDAIFVDTINSEKAGVAAECLSRGIAVLANKPLCTRFEHLEQIISVQQRKKGVLSLQLTERFNPVFMAMKKTIDEGTIGKPVAFQAAKPHRLHRPGMFRHGRPAWMFDKSKYGSVLIDLAIHDVDLVRWLSGAEVEHVSAVTGLSRFAGEHPDFTDYGMAFLGLSGGGCASVEVDWLNPAGIHSVRFVVYGTEGFATYDSSLKPGELIRIEKDNETSIVPGTAVNSIRANAMEFVRGVGEGKIPEPSGKDALIATLVTLCAQEAAETGKRVSVADSALFRRIQELPC